MIRRVFLLLAICGLSSPSLADERKFTAADYETFERKIRPILSRRCYSCHSARAKTVHGGLRLDSARSVIRGGDSGAVLVPGQPAKSLLVQAIEYRGDIQMPPKGKLPPQEIALIKAWVKRGAPFPPTTARPDRTKGGIDFAAGRRFWSFRPLQKQSLPPVKNTVWVRNRIDQFVLAQMEKRGLRPAKEADRITLIRRLSFDLTGLPPTPRQVQAFVRDRRPAAYERLVEHMMSSPQYGEKWARMWLDLARYTDKTASWLYKTSQAHLYRDWVVRAFNADMAYDEFVHRQLATDLIPETKPEDIAALGFISLSPTYWKELLLPCEIIKVIVADEWEERVDAVSRTFLGLTVACARCHDHKFDPISSADYYALAGIFASCRQVDRPLIAESKYKPVRLAKERVAKLEKEIARLRKTKPTPKARIARLVAQVGKLKKTPLYNTPMANAVSEESMYVVRAGKTSQNGTKLVYRSAPRDLPVFKRGNPNRPGPIVRRRFLTVLSPQDKPRPFTNGSGRLELARSITGEAAPLAARVIVNRIWLAHFGQGLVDTPSNFGHQGSRPSHPRLLDDLAARFISNGWSIKRLHREILLSATWRQSSRANERITKADPGNRWFTRTKRRRLDFEAWRDAMLFVSQQLDLKPGGPSMELAAVDNRRRTLYGTIHRRDMSKTLQIHDFPDPTQHSPKRTATVTALQGLFALNGPLLAKQAAALSERLKRDASQDAERIVQAYRLLFSRRPSDRELKLGLAFLGGSSEHSPAELWHQYAHVLLASNEFLFID